MNTKNERARDCKSDSAARTKLPASYLGNDTKEELTLTYIQSFLDQFTAQNPKRQRPYVIAENEYGVKKFVCTTLRPTQIAFSELYDMYECSSFLAGYILYEPLDPPAKPPRILFSPTETMHQHTGDSFDLAVLLCSLLIGAGYDAYVVCGYAPRHITLRDQSNTACPMVASLNDAFTKVKINKENEDEEPQTSEGINTLTHLRKNAENIPSHSTSEDAPLTHLGHARTNTENTLPHSPLDIHKTTPLTHSQPILKVSHNTNHRTIPSRAVSTSRKRMKSDG